MNEKQQQQSPWIKCTKDFQQAIGCKKDPGVVEFLSALEVQKFSQVPDYFTVSNGPYECFSCSVFWDKFCIVFHVRGDRISSIALISDWHDVIEFTSINEVLTYLVDKKHNILF
jgi:hypothetical protein